MRTWSEASSNESQGHPLNRLLLRIGAYAAITPLFRSASVLKKESLVTNDCGSSVKRSRHATTATESASSVIQSLGFMAVSFASKRQTDAEIPHARAGIRSVIDAPSARVAAHAVHLGIEARVVGRDQQVLTRDLGTTGLGAPQQATGKLVAEREGLEPQERAVLHQGAVNAAGAREVGAGNIGVGVLGRPPVEHVGPLVHEARGQTVEDARHVHDLIAVREVHEHIERERSVAQAVRQPAVELWIGVANDGAVVQVDLPVAVDVHDLVLAGRAISGVRQGARVSLLPQADGFEAKDRAERLAYPHDVRLPALHEAAAAHPREDLRRRPQVEHATAVVRDVQRTAP